MPTYEDAISALRAADEAGNHEDAARLAELAQSLKQAPREAKKEAASLRKPTKTESAGSVGSNPSNLVGMGENVLSAVSNVAGGVAGLATAAATAPFIGVDRALNKGADVVHGATYEPRTQSGKDIARLLSAPIEAGGKVLGSIGGEVAGDMAQSAGASPQTQGKIVAAGETLGENAIPMAMAATALKKPAPAELPPIPGKDYSPLRQFTPEQEARYARLKKEGYNPTLGQTVREPEQFRFEEHTAQRAEVGSPLLDRKVEQNAKLAENVEKQYPAGTTQLPDSATGKLVRSAVETKLLAKKAEVRAKYQAAEAAGETKQLVDVTPILKYLEDSAPESIAIPQLTAIQARLKKLLPKAEAAAEDTAMIGGKFRTAVKPKPDAPAPEISIDDLENLYKAANRLSKPSDAPSVKAMGDIKRLIDDVTEGKGGDLYKAARKARKEMGTEFEEQGGVARVVDKASRTDYKVDDSQLWSKVVDGSVEDLRQTLATLKRDVRPGDKTTAKTDQAALKGLQRKSMESVLEDATKSATKDAKGNPEFSPAAFKRSLDKLGRDKLNELWGKDETDRVYRIVDDAIELKTAPARVAGSTTMSNAQMLTDKVFTGRAAYALEHVASKLGIPGVPGLLRWGREQMVQYKDKQFTKAAVDEALTPTRETPVRVAEMAKPVKKAIRQIQMEEGKKRLKTPAAAILMKDKQPEEQP